MIIACLGAEGASNIEGMFLFTWAACTRGNSYMDLEQSGQDRHGPYVDRFSSEHKIEAEGVVVRDAILSEDSKMAVKY